MSAQVVDHSTEPAFYAVTNRKKHDHGNRQDEHHKALYAVGEDVGMGPAKDYVNQQYYPW